MRKYGRWSLERNTKFAYLLINHSIKYYPEYALSQLVPLMMFEYWGDKRFPGRGRTPVRTKSGPLRSSAHSWMRSSAAGLCRCNVFPNTCIHFSSSLSLMLLLSSGFLSTSCLTFTSFYSSPCPSCFPCCCSFPHFLGFCPFLVSSGCWCAYNHSGIFPSFLPPKWLRCLVHSHRLNRNNKALKALFYSLLGGTFQLK